MPQLTDLTGLFSIASVLAALALRLPRVKTLPKNKIVIFVAAVFLMLLIPFGDMPLAGYVRGMVGDLSISSAVLAWLQIGNALAGRVLTRQFGLKPDLQQYQHLWILLAITAIIFYPMTLGMSLYDPYRLGYSDAPFIAVVLLVATVAWFKRSCLIAWCLALAIIAWSLGSYESTNLWDYLLDPLLSIYALGAVLLIVM